MKSERNIYGIDLKAPAFGGDSEVFKVGPVCVKLYPQLGVSSLRAYQDLTSLAIHESRTICGAFRRQINPILLVGKLPLNGVAIPFAVSRWVDEGVKLTQLNTSDPVMAVRVWIDLLNFQKTFNARHPYWEIGLGKVNIRVLNWDTPTPSVIITDVRSRIRRCI